MGEISLTLSAKSEIFCCEVTLTETLSTEVKGIGATRSSLIDHNTMHWQLSMLSEVTLTETLSTEVKGTGPREAL